MKKLGPILALAAAALATGAGSAEAYPPITGLLTLDPSTVSPGETFSATFFGCDADETLNLDLAGTTVSATCSLLLCLTRCGPTFFPEPAARVTLTAPAAPGTYIVTGAALTSGATASAALTVVGATPTTPAGGLPATGSDSAPIAQVAAGLAAVGAGIVVVAGVRRRNAAA